MTVPVTNTAVVFAYSYEERLTAAQFSGTSELCAVDLLSHGRTIRLISLYCPPWNESSLEGVSRMQTFIDDLDVLLQTDHMIICCGDLNLPDLNWKDLSCSSSNSQGHSSKEELFRDFILAHGLRQLVREPTHRSGNILDLLLVNNDDLVPLLNIIRAEKEIPAPVKSDHAGVSFDVYMPFRCSNELLPSRDFQSADYDSIIDHLLLIPWETIAADSGGDVNVLSVHFSDVLDVLCQRFVPLRRSVTKKNRLPDHISSHHSSIRWIVSLHSLMIRVRKHCARSINL